MSIVALMMVITCVATITWIISLWMQAPEIANSYGLGRTGLQGNLGGSEGVFIVATMMAIAAITAMVSITRGLHPHRPALAQE